MALLRPAAATGQSPDHQFSTVPLTTLAVICWHGTMAVRRKAHMGHGRHGCPTTKAPYGEADPQGRFVQDLCYFDDCIDIFHEVLIDVTARLARRWATGEPPVDPVRYAARVVPTAVVDLHRRGRVAMGWPAKPTRADGKAAVVNAELVHSAPDMTVGEWYVRLFRILRGYANSEGRTGASWPMDGLAKEKAKYAAETDSDMSTTTVAEDIRHVLDIAAEAAGRTWVHQIIWHPLLSGVMRTELPDDLVAPGSELEDEILSRWFQAEYKARRSEGRTVIESFQAAGAAVSGRRVSEPDADVMAALEDLDLTAPPCFDTLVQPHRSMPASPVVAL